MTTHVDTTPTWAELGERHQALAETYATYRTECVDAGFTSEAAAAGFMAASHAAAARACELGIRLVEREPVGA